MAKDQKASKLGTDPLAARKGLSWLAPREGTARQEGSGAGAVSEPLPAPAAPLPKQTPTGEPRAKQKNASHLGLAEGYKRHTFILPETLVRRIKAIAFEQDRPVKEVVEEALQRFADGF